MVNGLLESRHQQTKSKLILHTLWKNHEMDRERKYKQPANFKTCNLVNSAGNTRKVKVLSVVCGLKVQSLSEKGTKLVEKLSSLVETILVFCGELLSLLTKTTRKFPHGKTQLETCRYFLLLSS